MQDASEYMNGSLSMTFKLMTKKLILMSFSFLSEHDLTHKFVEYLKKYWQNEQSYSCYLFDEINYLKKIQ